MVNNTCSSCSGNVNNSFCTMRKDMDVAMFKQCDGWHQAIIPPGKVIEVKSAEEIAESLSLREQRLLAKTDLGATWYKFISKGGNYSFRTHKYNFVEVDING